jgi:hypothetical protein
MAKIKGMLEAFWETGTEGVIWSVIDDHITMLPDGYRSYEDIHSLKDGDWLAIFNDAARTKILWEGRIDLEYKRNYTPYPRNPQYGQQAVGGMWVHGLQRDLSPEAWFELFKNRKHCTLEKQFGPYKPHHFD